MNYRGNVSPFNSVEDGNLKKIPREFRNRSFVATLVFQDGDGLLSQEELRKCETKFSSKEIEVGMDR